MPGQFSGSRKCNHGIFPRLSAPLGAAPSQDIINGARNAAAAAIVICCCSGNKQPREEKPLPSQLCSRSRLMSLDLFRTKARPSTPRQSNTQCPWLPTSPPFPSHVVSLAGSAAPHWIQGFKLLQGGRRTVCVKLCIHSMDAMHLVPADLSSLTPPFFPRWLGKFDTRARRRFIESRKKGERKNISQGLGIPEKEKSRKWKSRPPSGPSKIRGSSALKMTGE